MAQDERDDHSELGEMDVRVRALRMVLAGLTRRPPSTDAS